MVIPFIINGSKLYFYEFCLINFFSDMVSDLSDSPQNAKNELLYKIITANGNKQDHALKKLRD